MTATCTGRGRRDCECPQAKHVHGTYLAYVRDGCRGHACRAANTARESTRNRLKAYGRYDGLVDAEPVRAHIRLLSDHGVGLKQITRLTGVSGGVLSKLLYGQPLPDGTRRPPSRRCTPRVRDRILAVPTDALADGTRVDGTGTRRRLQALVACGWSQSKLARLLDMDPTNFTKVIRTEHVVLATKQAVAELYDQIWDTPPPQATHRDKIAYSRARRSAAERAFAPPMAWDDDTIDDPHAEPAITVDSDEEHDVLDEVAVERIMAGTLRVAKHAQSPERLEAIRRLAGRGYTDTEIGQRVGMAHSAVGWARKRHDIHAGVASVRQASEGDHLPRATPGVVGHPDVLARRHDQRDAAPVARHGHQPAALPRLAPDLGQQVIDLDGLVEGDAHVAVVQNHRHVRECA